MDGIRRVDNEPPSSTAWFNRRFAVRSTVTRSLYTICSLFAICSPISSGAGLFR